MTKRIVASEIGLMPHFKIRVVVEGAILHFASRTAPQLHRDPSRGGVEVTADWIEDGQYGDTLGYIDWTKVTAVTWRWSE